MAWYYEKISEDDHIVIYGYGCEIKVATGQLKYDKKTDEVTVLKIADNDTQEGAEWAASHLPSVIIRENYPEKTTVQIG